MLVLSFLLSCIPVLVWGVEITEEFCRGFDIKFWTLYSAGKHDEILQIWSKDAQLCTVTDKGSTCDNGTEKNNVLIFARLKVLDIHSVHVQKIIIRIR